MNQKKILSGTGVAIAAVLSMAIIILINATLTSWRLDLTENKLFTLSEGTLNIVRGLDEPVTLDFYVSRTSMAEIPQLVSYANRVHDLLDEYAAESNGKLRLNVIEPEPFSEEEDRAVASGLQGMPINAAGDMGYFGLVGTNSTDGEVTIPFFQYEREQKLEYDLTKLIFNLANPKKRVIGLVSTLPVFTPMMAGAPVWTVAQLVSEFFEVRMIDSALEINKDLDLLLVIHPKGLSELTQFAIDQYLLGGGKAMFFVDPLAEADRPQPNPENPYDVPVTSSNLEKLFTAWGISVSGTEIAADMTNAMRVQVRTDRGVEQTNYLPWMKLEKSNFNQDDFVTSELNIIALGSAGSISKNEGASVNFSPLIETSTEAMQMPAEVLQYKREPAQLLADFKSANRKFTLAARLSGKVSSAYPDGAPTADVNNPFDQDYVAPQQLLKEGEINAIVVADTDILSDEFWISQQDFFGVQVPQPTADNGNFVINALENMSGSSDLISLRNRGEYARPFTVVDDIRRDAESEFREQQQMLETKLAETEKKIAELQQEKTGSELLLSDAQRAEIDNFRLEQVNTRKELRAVQHELQKNIEQLGTVLKFINIGLTPLLIVLFALTAGMLRSRRKSTDNPVK
jgi:ABC-type uncharacterized transport system involved in gliding motility auxiliary subunit